MNKPIEQQFYEAFDIPKKQMGDFEFYNKRFKNKLIYPPITEHILLELEDVLLKQTTHIEYDYVDGEYWGQCEIPLSTSRGKSRKECLLKMLISIANMHESNTYYYDKEDIVYNEVRKIMGVEGKN